MFGANGVSAEHYQVRVFGVEVMVPAQYAEDLGSRTNLADEFAFGYAGTGASMKSFLLAKVRRRDVFRAAAAGAAIAASGTTAIEAAGAEPTGSAKRKARYQPNSPEVQNFYRVNRYPVR
jgi:hypothetical protein